VLVLSRRPGEQIAIGESGDITVRVLGITVDGKVRLGIVAPAEIPVHRQEIYREIYGGNCRPLPSNSAALQSA